MAEQTQLNTLKRSADRSRPRRDALAAALWPLGLLIGFGLLMLLLFGDRLRPRVPVRVATVLLLDAPEGAVPAGAPGGRTIAQASGWIEPDPFPIGVPAKTEGYVESVLVLAGEPVTNGQVIATLDPADQTLEVEASRARADEMSRAIDSTAAELRMAGVSVSQAIARVEVEQAALLDARDKLDRINRLNDFDTSPREKTAAEQRAAAHRASADAARLEVAHARAREDRLRAELVRVRYSADRLEAEAQLADLHLARTRVRAPSDGVVLQRHVQPGQKLGAESVGTSIISLYNPTQLQVRADVPLSDVGHVRIGQSAVISASAFPRANLRWDSDSHCRRSRHRA